MCTLHTHNEWRRKTFIFCIMKHVNNLTFSHLLLSFDTSFLVRWKDEKLRSNRMTKQENETIHDEWNQCKFQSCRFMQYSCIYIWQHHWHISHSLIFISPIFMKTRHFLFDKEETFCFSFLLSHETNQRHYLCEQHTKVISSSLQRKNNYI